MKRTAFYDTLHKAFTDAQEKDYITSPLPQAGISLAKAMSWRQRIAEAELRGAFSTESKKLALNWSCCAVGEKCHYVVFNKLATLPYEIEEKLDEWGMEFMFAVRVDDIATARDRYEKINALEFPREVVAGYAGLRES